MSLFSRKKVYGDEDHMHEFDTDERSLGCIERFEPQHGPCHPLHASMVLFQMPLVPWLGASTLQLIGIVLPKLQTPLADGLVRHLDAALTQELLHVAVA